VWGRGLARESEIKEFMVENLSIGSHTKRNSTNNGNSGNDVTAVTEVSRILR